MWRRTKKVIDLAPVADDFREWAASLPVVVERDHGSSASVRMYDVDCEPLAQRGTWLVLDFASDLARPTGIVVVLPQRVADHATRAGWGINTVPTDALAPRGRAIFRVDPLAGRRYLEAVVVGAYRSIAEWT